MYRNVGIKRDKNHDQMITETICGFKVMTV